MTVSETLSQINPSSLMLFSQEFCPSDGKLTLVRDTEEMQALDQSTAHNSTCAKRGAGDCDTAEKGPGCLACLWSPGRSL
jgi:hypothetical protein